MKEYLFNKTKKQKQQNKSKNKTLFYIQIINNSFVKKRNGKTNGL